MSSSHRYLGRGWVNRDFFFVYGIQAKSTDTGGGEDVLLWYLQKSILGEISQAGLAPGPSKPSRASIIIMILLLF